MLNKKARELIHYKQIIVQTAADISLKENYANCSGTSMEK